MKHLILPMFLIVCLTLIASYSFYTFYIFEPASVASKTQIKGVSNQKSSLDLPFPQNYKILSTDESAARKVILFETTDSPEKMQNFYKSVLLGKGWKLDSQGNQGIFLISKYKSARDGAEDKEVSVISSRQNATNSTVVTLNFRN